MTKVKICGLMQKEDIRAVNEARPDYVGFVFATSPREVSEFQAVRLCQDLSGDIKIVGVFVDDSPERIISIADDGVLDAVQLHGHEDKKYVEYLKENIDLPIIKAIRVKDAKRFGYVKSTKCDYILLDTYDPHIFGGTGKTFNWDAIPKKMPLPFFLAGGINIGNVKEAVATGAYCIDVSSGLESVAGKKDRQKIIDFMEAVREAQKC